ncbi:hypothetical protein M9Y10_006596 [Tritrichomonas musculus]|uniref:3'-5' exonuclease domain-containing protein n=1 Tax=Tritrichomonas musculus TaxID=1915356 RepID=A0ABR2JFL8_9EUKA
MSFGNTLSYVKCPITGAQFHIVRKELQENVDLFIKWTDDILKRANNGKIIHISLDCEGYLLGSTTKSLSCIQIGEIFNDTFNPYVNDIPKSVGNKPGFIIETPISAKVKECLSKILYLPCVIIYTFDFTCDFATMFEAGINIKFTNVFDSQVATQQPSPYVRVEDLRFIQNTSGKSLFWFVEKARFYDQLGERAYIMKNRDKKNYFRVSAYLYKDSQNPAIDVLTKELLEMGAADVYMTGLAALYCFKNQLAKKVFNYTSAKMREFIYLINCHKSYLAPSIYRHLFFIDNYCPWKYDNKILLLDETEDNLLNLLQIFLDTYSIMSSYEILNINTISKTSFSKAEEYNHEVVKKLEKNKDRLIRMMNAYA